MQSGNANIDKLRQFGACGNRFGSLTLMSDIALSIREIKRWSGKSHPSKLITIVLAVAIAERSYAQDAQGPALTPGFSFEAAQALAQPVAAIVGSLLWVVASTWNYIMSNPPAAILLSALTAFIVAYTSIQSQREMTRLKETFGTIDNGIRDGDVIKSRTDFRKIKNELKANKDTIAKYHSPNVDDDVMKAQTLRTILNDYENIALGIRYRILDEEYLYRWTKSGLIDDWNSLMPLVTAYRSAGAPNAYIEFEGLATSWQKERSYRSGKALKSPKRNTQIH